MSEDRDAKQRADLEKIRARLAAIDPDLEAAIDEVDRTLIRECLALSPIDRHRRCEARSAEIDELRRSWARR